MLDDSSSSEALEQNGFTNAVQAPLPRRVLGRGALALLILLRVYVVIAIPIVAYAFIHALRVSAH